MRESGADGMSILLSDNEHQQLAVCEHSFIKTKDLFNGGARFFAAIYTFGISEIANNTCYKCLKCGKVIYP